MYFQECVMYFQDSYVFSLQDKMAVNSVFNKHLMIMISTLHNSTKSKTMTSKNSTKSKTMTSKNSTRSKTMTSKNSTRSKTMTSKNSTRSKTMTSKNSTRSNSTSVYISLFICHFSL